MFIEQHEGFVDSKFPHHVCKLKKSLYGLKQTPRTWYDKLKTYLLQYGFRFSASDNSFFHMRNNDKLLLVLVYVDDILITGEDPSLVS